MSLSARVAQLERDLDVRKGPPRTVLLMVWDGGAEALLDNGPS